MNVILYDGVCIFCSRWVRFVATAIRSEDSVSPRSSRPMAPGWRRRFGIDPDDPDTNAVVHGGVAWFKSDAALTVLSALPDGDGHGRCFAVPKPVRNAVYVPSRETGTGSSESTTNVSCPMRICGEGDGVGLQPHLKDASNDRGSR
jgi:predicted DCC family thiol-disulfide oxidoreductase YuxK